jgi:LPS-assembly protein
VDQTKIPLFDTSSAGFGITQIFSENTFVGNDRVADNNKVTAGFTARITLMLILVLKKFGVF